MINSNKSHFVLMCLMVHAVNLKQQKAYTKLHCQASFFFITCCPFIFCHSKLTHMEGPERQHSGICLEHADPGRPWVQFPYGLLSLSGEILSPVPGVTPEHFKGIEIAKKEVEFSLFTDDILSLEKF